MSHLPLNHVLSWGSNSHGQLGVGFRSEQVSIPTDLLIREEIRTIVGGGKNTLIALKSNETLTCGDNDKGQLGIDQEFALNFQLLPALSNLRVTKISCGWDFNICLANYTDVYGWGSNTFGQLGFSVESVKRLNSPLKLRSGIQDVAAGLRHSILNTLNGCIYASGFNSKGQLGFSTPSLNFCSEFLKVPELTNVSHIDCGEHFSVAVCDGEKIVAWGDNKYSQLGKPGESIKGFNGLNVVKDCEFADNFIKKLCCGWAHAALLTVSGKIVTWGRNDYGQLGRITDEPWKPKHIASDCTFIDVAVGSHHSIALTSDKKIFTWGWNEHANCGQGTTENIQEPLELKLPLGFTPEIIGTGAAHNFVFGSKVDRN